MSRFSSRCRAAGSLYGGLSDQFHASPRFATSALLAALVFGASATLLALPVASAFASSSEDSSSAPNLVVDIEVADRADAIALDRVLDVWDWDPRVDRMQAEVTREQLLALQRAGFAVQVNDQATADLGRSLTPLPGQFAGIPSFPCYRTVEETYTDLSGLATSHPGLAQWVDIGDSWNKEQGIGGYDIQALQISNFQSTLPKASFILQAAMHARELTTAEVATRFAEQLVNGYGVDPDITWVLDHSIVHIVAHLNPDGRKIAETGLSQRKNRNSTITCGSTTSQGVDLNRNSTYFWTEPYSSGNGCAADFRGPSEASEPETQSIETYMAQHLIDQRGDDPTLAAPTDAEGVFISLHSFGRWVLYPWEGYDNGVPPNNDELRSFGRKMGHAFGTSFSVCKSLDPGCLFFSSGTTVDQAYGEYGVAAYTLELGTTFFQSCSSFENSIVTTALDALFVAAKNARLPYQWSLGPDAVNVALAQASTVVGTPVTLAATADDTRYESGGFGAEPTQNIAAVRFTVDAAPWTVAPGTAMVAVDGAFDSDTEAVMATLDTSSLLPGRHLIFVQAEDAAGNLGAPSAVFLEIIGNDVFSDGFETGDTLRWSETFNP